MPTRICRVCGARSTASTCPSCGGTTVPARLETESAASAAEGKATTAATMTRTPVAAAPRGSQRGRPSPRGGHLAVGAVAADVVALYVRNLFPYLFVTMLLSTAPAWLLDVWVAPEPPAEPRDLLRSLAFAPLTWLLSNLATAAVTYGAIQHLRGTPAPVGSWIVHALRCLVPVVLVSLLASLLIAVPWGLAAYAVIGDVPFGILLALVGFVVGLMALLALSVAIPVAVVERPGILAALSRSRVLTAGARWRILGVYSVLFLLALFVVVPLNLLEVPWLGHVAQALVAPLAALMPALLYHALRVSKEGSDAESIAAVFD